MVSTIPAYLYPTPSWSLDGHSVMLIESGGSAYAWNLSANTLIDKSSFYQSHKGLAIAEFGPYYVVYIFLTGAVQVFDPVTGAVIVDYQDQRNHRWEHLLYNTDEKKMALISGQNDFQIWDLQTGQVERSFFLPGSLALLHQTDETLGQCRDHNQRIAARKTVFIVRQTCVTPGLAPFVDQHRMRLVLATDSLCQQSARLSR